MVFPLTRLTSIKEKWQWADVEQKVFDVIKRFISRETLLAYPDFKQPFAIHIDASHTHLGAVVSQANKPIAFYSRKLNPAQTRYTTTERELLSIVETLKEFQNKRFGQKIVAYIDHKNPTYKNFNTEQVMRWRLISDEYNPELKHIKEENNVVDDALSRLEMLPLESQPTQLNMAEHFGLEVDDIPEDSFPLSYKTLMIHQQPDLALLIKSKRS